MWGDEPESTETPAKHYVYDSEPGKQLREAVFDKLRDKLAGCSHLVIAPDGDLNLVPFQILPEDDDTKLQDRYNISYVSVGRDLLRRRIKTKGMANEPLIIADPNFDWPQHDADNQKPESNVAVSSLNVSQVFGTLAGVRFERVKATADFAENAGQKLGVKPFLQNKATGDRLLKCKSPKLLIVATHGYYSQRGEEYRRLLIELLKCSQEKQAEILAKNYGFVDEEFLKYIEALQNDEDIDRETREKLGAIYSLVKRQINTTSAKPPVNNMEFETFQPNRLQAKVENPMMRSAIALTGANTWLSGGQLPEKFPTMVFAQDIAGIDLWQTELTILIACQSGLGDVQTGEGVFGLRRAFAVAGSKTLIMSLWSVPTLATMLLMEQFLDYLKAGIGPAEALKKAQKYIINVTVGELQKSKLGQDILAELMLGNNLKIDSQPLAHPYFWGAWVCQGES
ncbi:MAG: CHAT domain-containing protein [Okeania sp.]|nr:CHAT domain-containing protein [Okeania sp.]